MRFALIFAASFVANTALATPADWEVDASHSRVGFVAKHLLVTKVRGSFKTYDAKVKADDKTGKIESIDATVKTTSVTTDNDKRDGHLRGDDFFNVEKFPDMKVKTKKVTWDGDKFTAETELTIRDVTKVVVFKGEKSAVQKVDFGGGLRLTVGYSATATVNRKEFKLMWSKAIEAVPVVADDITIELEIEMGRKAG